MHTRREWIKRSGSSLVMLLLTISSASMGLAGCNVYDDIYNWIGVAVASLNSIVTILKANGVIPAEGIINAILGALNAVKEAIDEYRMTTPHPTGAVAKIELALKSSVDQFSVFLKSLGIGSFGLFSMIAALVQIILSTIAGFLNRLPPSTQLTVSTAQHMNTVMQIAQITGMAVTPKACTIRQYKKDWNAALDNGPALDVIVPRSAYHKIGFWEKLP